MRLREEDDGDADSEVDRPIKSGFGCWMPD